MGLLLDKNAVVYGAGGAIGERRHEDPVPDRSGGGAAHGGEGLRRDPDHHRWTARSYCGARSD